MREPGSFLWISMVSQDKRDRMGDGFSPVPAARGARQSRLSKSRAMGAAQSSSSDPMLRMPLMA